MDPSYGFLPNSILDKDDLNIMSEIEKIDTDTKANATPVLTGARVGRADVRQVTQSQTENPLPRKISITNNYNQGHGSVLDELDDDF